jgi:hypothetical protein
MSSGSLVQHLQGLPNTCHQETRVDQWLLLVCPPFRDWASPPPSLSSALLFLTAIHCLRVLVGECSQPYSFALHTVAARAGRLILTGEFFLRGEPLQAHEPFNVV